MEKKKNSQSPNTSGSPPGSEADNADRLDNHYETANHSRNDANPSSMDPTDSNKSQTHKDKDSFIIDEMRNDASHNRTNRFESNKKYFTISIYALFVIAIGAIIAYMVLNMDQTRASLLNFIGILSPFIGAFFIAYLLNPMVKKIHLFFYHKVFKENRMTLSKVLAIITAYLLVAAFIAITIGYITPQIIKSLKDLSLRLPAMYEAISDYIYNLDAHFPNLDLAFIEKKIKDSLPQIISYGTDLATNVVPMIYTFSISIVRGFINILLAIVISCYMLSDKNKIMHNAKRILYAILPAEKAAVFCETASTCNTIFSSFIVGKSIDSLIIGILCFILMSILRLPYSILISVIVGITNMIPYFGPFIGAIPGLLIYLFINPVQSIIFGIMILILQQFDGLILGPKILGDSTGLTPLWVIFGITLGGAYGGVLGMFLGVPIVAVVSYLMNKVISSRLNRKNITIDNDKNQI